MRAPPAQATGNTSLLAQMGGGMDIRSIRPGERATRNLGDLEELKTSIAAEGLLHDITITPRGRLVLGYRRWRACRELGWAEIPATTVTTVEEALNRMARDDAGATCVQPLTVEEAVLMDFMVRELDWWPKDGSATTGGRRDGRREWIAQHYTAGGKRFNGGQYGVARMIVNAARGHKEYHGRLTPIPAEAQRRAAEALQLVRTPADLRAARRLYLGVTDYETHPASGPRRTPTRKQEAAVSSALATLSGLMTGFDGLTALDPAIPPAVLSRWDRDLGDAIRILGNFRRKVQRHHGHGDND